MNKRELEFFNRLDETDRHVDSDNVLRGRVRSVMKESPEYGHRMVAALISHAYGEKVSDAKVLQMMREEGAKNPEGSGGPGTFIPHPDFDPDDHDIDEARSHIDALAQGLRRMHESGTHDIFQHFATQMYQGRSANAKDPYNQFDNASLEHLVHGAISALRGGRNT